MIDVGYNHHHGRDRHPVLDRVLLDEARVEETEAPAVEAAPLARGEETPLVVQIPRLLDAGLVDDDPVEDTPPPPDVPPVPEPFTPSREW